MPNRGPPGDPGPRFRPVQSANLPAARAREVAWLGRSEAAFPGRLRPGPQKKAAPPAGRG